MTLGHHEVFEWLPLATIPELLFIGSRIASCDYAVLHYHDKGHPKFYHKREVLLKSVRRELPRYWRKKTKTWQGRDMACVFFNESESIEKLQEYIQNQITCDQETQEYLAKQDTF